MLALSAAGHEVTTVEHVARAGDLHPVQEALHRHHAVQCGFCTPGVVIAAIDLLARVPSPDEAQVRAALAGNLCRCTGYAGIVAAVVDARATADGITADRTPVGGDPR